MNAWGQQRVRPNRDSALFSSYAFSRPVILLGLTDNSVSACYPLAKFCPCGARCLSLLSPTSLQRFRALCARDRLLASFGNNVVRLSTANTYSYQKGELLHLPA